MVYAALGSIIVTCIVLPFVIFLVTIIRDKESKLRQLIFFVTGVVVYFATQWGMKEKGLQWLFNNKKTTGFDMFSFMANHYFLYLAAVACSGALLLYVVSFLLFRFVFHRNYTVKNIFMYGLGFGMSESIMLAGMKSIYTLYEMKKGTEGEIGSGTMELFLSGYERLLFVFIHISLLIVLAYFIQKKQNFGLLVTIFCETLAGFLPGFFIAFSTVNYLEIYSRTVALGIIYTILTLAVITGFIVIINLRYSFEKINCTEKKPKKQAKMD